MAPAEPPLPLMGGRSGHLPTIQEERALMRNVPEEPTLMLEESTAPPTIRGTTLLPNQLPQVPAEEIPLGGRLKQFTKVWKAIGSSQWIMDLVSNGFSIHLGDGMEWPRDPPCPYPMKNNDLQIMDTEVNRLLHNGCVELILEPEVTNALGCHYSPMFLRDKPDNPVEKRPLINLRTLNGRMTVKHFRLEGWLTVKDLLRKGMYLTKVDLSKAYFHLPCREIYHDLLRFTHRGNHYRYRVLPQGLSTSPWIFTKLMKAVTAYLRSLGIRLVCYLDDLLIMGRTREECLQHTDWVMTTLTRLGFLLNKGKSIVEPSQTIEFLGLLINSTDMTFQVPKRKLRSIRKEAQQMLNREVTTPRKLASFLGRCNFLSQALRHSTLHTRALLRLKNQALVQDRQGWDKKIPMTQEAQENLQFWVKECHHWDGKQIRIDESEYNLRLETDASPTGWGAVVRYPNNHTETTYGHWGPTETHQSSNWKELKTILLALRSLIPPDSRVHLFSDNKTTVSYIRKEGGKFPHLNQLAMETWKDAMNRNINMIVDHIPGVDNTVADELSRRKYSHQDWQLNPEIFQHITRHEQPRIDLFATRNNTQCPLYYSRFPDPNCAGVDAFNQQWNQHQLAYANPPFILLSRVVAKVRRERARVLLIAPVWKTAPWFPDLLEMCHGTYHVLPQREDMFLPVSTQHERPIRAPPWECALWKCNFG